MVDNGMYGQVPMTNRQIQQQQEKDESIANYVYDTMLELLDYSGNIAKIKKAAGKRRMTPVQLRDQLKSVTYAKDYSPNNIRTLIISSDGLAILLHKQYKGKSYIFKPFNATKYGMCIKSSNYKPMYDAIKDSNVTQALEEIVICKKSENNIPLRENIDMSLFVNDNRYKRFYSYTEVDKSIKEVMQAGLTNKEQIGHYKVGKPIAKIFKDNGARSSVRNADYLKVTGCVQTNTYEFDREMHEYFKGIADVLAEQDKKQAEEDRRKVRQGDKEDKDEFKSNREELKELIENINSKCNMIHKFNRLVLRYGNSLANSSGITKYVLDTYRDNELGNKVFELKTIKDNVDNYKALVEFDKAKKEVNEISSFADTTVTLMYANLYNALDKETLDVIYKEADNDSIMINIVENGGFTDRITEYNHVYNGKVSAKSDVAILTILSKLFITNNVEDCHNSKKWKDLLMGTPKKESVA